MNNENHEQGGRHFLGRNNKPLLVSVCFVCVFAVLQGRFLVFVSTGSHHPDDVNHEIALGVRPPIAAQKKKKKKKSGNKKNIVELIKQQHNDARRRVQQERKHFHDAATDAIRQRASEVRDEIEQGDGPSQAENTDPDTNKEARFVDDEAASKDDDDDNKTSEKKKKPLNILFFYGDDWRYDSMGALNPIVHTPNLDQLAREGMMFVQNAVTTSICWISRATLATGQHYARHRAKEIGDPVPFHDYWNETLFGRLSAAGYFTGMVGKWQPGGIRDHMFNISNSYSGYHYYGNEHVIDMDEKLAIGFLRNQRRYRQAESAPFALFVNFFAPHHEDGRKEQYFPQNKTKELYRNITVPFAPTCTEDSWKKMPHFFSEWNEGRLRWKDRFDEPSKAQAMIKNYFRLISGVDAAVGKVLEELERQNLTENTLVVFTTDNGYYHAEHGIAGKWYAHQESVRVPLVIKDPRMDEALIGTKNHDLTLSIDLAPTLLRAAGIPVPERMQGRDVSRLYTTAASHDDTTAKEEEDDAAATPTTKKKRRWRNSYFYEYPGITGNNLHIPVQALVRKDFKYIYWPTQAWEELYHLPSDKYEEHDLSKNETFATHMNKLRRWFIKARANAQ